MSAVENPTDAVESAIHLEPLVEMSVEIPLIGVTPVIPQKWSEKARMMMLSKQQGKAKAKPPPKDPKEEAEGMTYYLPDGRPGLPATAFKGAIVSGCRFFKGLPMTRAKMAIFTEGQDRDEQGNWLVAIDGDRTMREDQPRNETGVADLRFRYAYFPWRVMLPVRFVVSEISRDAVFALVNAGGMAGVGSWRPSSPKSNTGTFGQFKVATPEDFKNFKKGM